MNKKLVSDGETVWRHAHHNWRTERRNALNGVPYAGLTAMCCYSVCRDLINSRKDGRDYFLIAVQQNLGGLQWQA